MDILDGIRGSVGFLTIIPVNGGSLKSAAKYNSLFPAIGALIGLLAGLPSIMFFRYLPDLLSGLLAVGVILLITGLHHTDGLLDLGDGVMKMGSPEEKIEAMHDKNTGVGGFTLTLLVVMATMFSVSNLETIILEGLVACEIVAKFSMLFSAKVGKSAHEGLNTIFIKSIHSNRGTVNLVLALAFSIPILLSLLGTDGLFVLIFPLIITMILVLISNRHFGGLTGDVLGATNEISRLSALITLLVI